MTTTLSDPAQRPESRRPTPSAWSTPRPDGPLAEALRRAAAQRASTPAPQDDPQAEALEDLPAHLLPPAPGQAAHSGDDALDDGFDDLARQARERDKLREANAIALEWPESGSARRRTRRARAGWTALAAALLLAAGAAGVAMVATDDGAAPAAGAGSLKLDHNLGSAPAKAR